MKRKWKDEKYREKYEKKLKCHREEVYVLQQMNPVNEMRVMAHMETPCNNKFELKSVALVTCCEYPKLKYEEVED